MRIITSKFKEVVTAVIPVVVIVLLVHFLIAPMESVLIYRFLLGSVFVVLGLTLFLFGVDLGITPLGSHTGGGIAKSNKLWIVIVAGLILGFFISIAEPGLMVLASQVGQVTDQLISSTSILVTVSIGLAVMLCLGFLRVFYNVSLRLFLLVSYVIILLLAYVISPEFLAISFDASGATTGILAVPFILALSYGISSLKKGSEASEEDSFGLVAIASVGAILGVMILQLVSGITEFQASLEIAATSGGRVFDTFRNQFSTVLTDAIISIAPLLVILLILQKIWFKLSMRELRKIITGFIFAFLGLIIFLLGVNAGFMDVGSMMGRNLAVMDNHVIITLVAFVIGVVTILAEPAVYVLVNQIEDVTAGYVKKKAVLVSLAIGVGLAVALSVIRILSPALELWHFIVPGYIINLTLMFLTPTLFVGIAFDAGGVATGPITATFILAFVQGAADAYQGADLMIDGFGMIAMVAMMPILTLQILGIIFKVKSRRKEAQHD